MLELSLLPLVKHLLQGEGHNGHGTSNTRSVFNITAARTSNSNAAGLWIGARTNQKYSSYRNQNLCNLAFETYNSGWGEKDSAYSQIGSVGVGDFSSTSLTHAFQVLKTSGTTVASAKNTNGNATFYAEALAVTLQS